MANLERAKFGSKLGVILAAAGSAVGLGNIWRFPFETGQHGGAAFIIIYLFCVFILGVPVMIAEFLIGRHTQSNTARAYRMMANGTPWGILGYVGVFTGFIILGYYSVIAGWTLQYLYSSLMGHLHGLTPSQFAGYFDAFVSNPVKPLVWLSIFMFLTHFVIVHGIQNGIEKASKLMMPALFIIILILVVCSLMLPNSMKGVEFLLKPDFSKVNSEVFLGALGQAFFSLSLGMGCLCTYASYFSKQTNLTKTAIQVSVIDTVVSILASLIIFPAAFSVGINPDSGPSLLFITLPNVFQQAFLTVPAVGYIFSLLFYVLLALAALTSTISIHEVVTAFVHEEMHLTRKKAAIIVSTGCLIIGFLSSLSLGYCNNLKIGGLSFFDSCDFLSAQILLPLGGLGTSIFVGWFIQHRIVHDEITNWGTVRVKFFHVFIFVLKYVCPACIIGIFLHQLNLI
jgi:neurotransmitter:Na+ symporter, NSS family